MKQVQGLDRYAKVKFSKIDFHEAVPQQQARVAMAMLMKNGYTSMNSYAMNEIIKLIRSLTELKLEYNMKSFFMTSGNVNSNDKSTLLYEFALGYFEDDRQGS